VSDDAWGHWKKFPNPKLETQIFHDGAMKGVPKKSKPRNTTILWWGHEKSSQKIQD